MRKLLLIITLFTNLCLSASLPPEFSAIADIVAYKSSGEHTQI